MATWYLGWWMVEGSKYHVELIEVRASYPDIMVLKKGHINKTSSETRVIRGLYQSVLPQAQVGQLPDFPKLAPTLISYTSILVLFQIAQYLILIALHV
uniref:Putative ovule protein n=1 Tax=Solanum chacoense TaxID=4108 RepID=A0A0V0HVV2_SOLCH